MPKFSETTTTTVAPMLLLLSFAAGVVVTATASYWNKNSIHQQQEQHHPNALTKTKKTVCLEEEEEADQDDDELNYEDYRNSEHDNHNKNKDIINQNQNSKEVPMIGPIFLRWPSIEDIKSRIGELPSSIKNSYHSSNSSSNNNQRRTRWNWDRKTRSRSQSPDAGGGGAAQRRNSASSNTESSSPDNDNNSSNKSNNKSEFCIGSIFGLDVGGTLAKLVYFESKAEQSDYSEFHRPIRERIYRSSASAKAVLLARRGGLHYFDENEAYDENDEYENNDDDDDDDHEEQSGSAAAKEREKKGTGGGGDGGKSPPIPPILRRPRSISIGERFRRASLSPSRAPKPNTNSEQQEQSPQQQAPQSPPSPPRPQHHRTQSLYSHLHFHSADSNADLQALYPLRLESVPDDLDAYAKSVLENNKKKDNNNNNQRNPQQQQHPNQNQHHRTAADEVTGGATFTSGTSSTTCSSSLMRKSRSMLEMSQGRMKALDRFYTFARRLDSYRMGIKDDKLSFYSRVLGGEFHFIRFESRRMQNAMDLIRANNLHLTIREMGATGGGAHKFASQWEAELGITMKKQGELDSLVAGMQFVLSTVVGECYTFRPRTSATTSSNNINPGDGTATAPSPSRQSSSSSSGHNYPARPTATTAEAAATRKHSATAASPPAPAVVPPPAGAANISRTSSFDSSGHPVGVPLEDDSDQEEQDNNSNKKASSTKGHPVGVPLEDDSDQEEQGQDNKKASSTNGEGGVGSTAFEQQQQQQQDRDRGKGDEWWWSRKVQRDAISDSSTYPYLLVTIGTGVSILRVDGPRKHVRVSGSTIGGGTYWGLIRLLTDMEDFDAALRLAERGDPSKVDMMVGDIYGSSDVVEKMGLRPDLVASSFGKLVAKDDPASDLKEEDLARALLLMITINIGQVAYLNAQLHKTSRIYFVGNFLRENKISQRRLSFAIDYWSKGEMEALFLEHEGYFGALGAFLLSQGISQNDLLGRRQTLRSQKSMPAPKNGNGGRTSPSSQGSSSHQGRNLKRRETLGSLEHRELPEEFQ